MNLNLKILAIAAATTVAFALPASAVTISFGTLPTAAMPNPTADATTGTVFENVTGSISGVRRSPWQGSSVDENAADSFYTSISGRSSATYNFATAAREISFVWGSPDTYNDLDIILSGGGGTVTVNGSQAFGTAGLLAEFVTISDVGLFDSVTFRSGSNAFEFANLNVAPVPLPAGILLLGTALGGLGFAHRRKAKKTAV